MPKVLIVDDEPHIRQLLEQTLEDLEEEGVELLLAGDGRTAFDIICRDRPELVFLDVMMPEMSGFEVCERVKNDCSMKGICIIMLTAKGQEFDKEKGRAAGADLYMTKPFDPDEVLETAREVLGLKR